MEINFGKLADQAFSFLTNLGFLKLKSNSCTSIFRKNAVEIVISWDQVSHEVSLSVGNGYEKYSIGEIIALSNKELAEQYRDYTGSSEGELTRALERLVAVAKRYGGEAFEGNVNLFAALKIRREEWKNSYAIETLASALRPKAAQAFKDADYDTAVKLFSQIECVLTDAERMKLNIARVRKLKNI